MDDDRTLTPGSLYANYDGVFLLVSIEPPCALDISDGCSLVPLGVLRTAKPLTPDESDTRLAKWAQRATEKRVIARHEYDRCVEEIGRIKQIRVLVDRLRGAT